MDLVNKIIVIIKDKVQLVMDDNKLIKLILDNLQKNISEKKKKSKKKPNGMRSVQKGADDNPKVTRMDFLPDDVLRYC